MGNPTRTFELNFAKGLQTKTDPKQQLQGNLLELENGVFDRIGRLNKRTGFDSLPNTYNGGSFQSGKALASINDELNLMDGSYLYGYSDAANSWIRKGKLSSAVCTNFEVVQNNDQQTNPDVAYAAGLECHVREDTRGGVYYSIHDYATRTVIVSDTVLNANGLKPKVFALNNIFVVVYATVSNQLKYHTLSIDGVVNGFGASANFCTNLHASNHNFDGVVTGNRLFIAYNTDASSIKVKYLDTTLTLGAEYNQASITASDTIGVWTDSNQSVWVASYDGSVLKLFVVSYNGVQVLGNTTLETVSNVYRVTGLVADGTATVWYEINAAQTYNQLVRRVTCTSGGTVSTPAVWKRSVGLAGKAFSHGGGAHVPVAHQSQLQSTYFVLDADGDVVARMLSGVAGGLAERKVLPSVCTVESGVYLLPNTVRSSIKSDAGIFYSTLGVNVSRLDWNSNRYVNTYQGENLLVGGSVVHSFDGANVTEHNFHLYPENLVLTRSNVGGGLAADGYYFYKAVFAWYDNRGNLHRSAPSVAIQTQMTDGYDTVTCTVPTLRLSRKTRVIIELYRTEANGTVYYKCTSTALPEYNDPLNDSIDIVDQMSDSDLTSNEILYTEGEVYNSAPPSAGVIATHKNRCWLAALEDPNTLWYSKRLVVGQPVNFHEGFTIRLAATGGAITDLVSMNEMLVIFKESAIYVLSGDGPLNTGAQSDYRDPQLLTSEVGAIRSGCLAEIPDGIVFVSDKGVYLVGRGGGVVPFGVEVEELIQSETVVSVVAIPTTNRVAFVTESGTWLVYDYVFRQWGTWTNLPAVDAIDWNDSIVCLQSNGQPLVQGEGFTDNGSPYSLYLSTSWLSPAGQQGFFQLHRMMILGDYKSSHELVVELYRDYSSRERSFVIDVDSTLDRFAYGDGYYGVSGFGGVTPRYQFQLKPNVRAQSFRVVLYDDAPVGESMSLSGLRFEIATMGANQLPEKSKR